MNTTGIATFSTNTWEEITYAEIDDGRKLARVQAGFDYQGDIEAKGSVEYLMAYSPDGTGSFVGLEHIVGRIGDRIGSFVAQHTGTFDSQSITTLWEIIPGLGTEALEGLRGGGKLKLAGHGPYPFNFEYNFNR